MDTLTNLLKHIDALEDHMESLEEGSELYREFDNEFNYYLGAIDAIREADEEVPLKVYEINYAVSPGGVDSFEVYQDGISRPIFESESFTETMEFCYNQEKNFTVHTLVAYEKGFTDGDE
jgi:exonuclease VII small subunit